MFEKYISFLRLIPLFQNLSNNEFTNVLPYIQIKEFKKNDIIIFENTESNFFYILYKGIVKVFKDYESEKLEIAEKKPGDYFGELSFIDNMKRSATCIAESDVITFSMDKIGFTKLLSFPQTSMHLLKNVVRDLRDQNNRIIKAHYFGKFVKVKENIEEIDRIGDELRGKYSKEDFDRLFEKINNIKAVLHE